VLEGEWLILEQEPPRAMYFVQDGRFAMTRGGAELARLAAGSFLGEVPALFEGVELQPFGALALGDANNAFALPRAAFGELARLYPEMPPILATISRQRLEKLGLLADVAARAANRAAATHSREAATLDLLQHLFAHERNREMAREMILHHDVSFKAPAASAEGGAAGGGGEAEEKTEGAASPSRPCAGSA
jgi:CRP-like cAMP-binding protein